MSAYDKVPGVQGPTTTYIKIPGVQGSSTEISHLKWIETLSWDWPVAPEFRECSFTMKFDAATQQLIVKAQSGEQISDVRVDITRDVGKLKRTVTKIVLADVLIVSVEGNPPSVRLNYQKVAWENV
jgi:type VI protein secretion system component Hcp